MARQVLLHSPFQMTFRCFFPRGTRNSPRVGSIGIDEEPDPPGCGSSLKGCKVSPPVDHHPAGFCQPFSPREGLVSICDLFFCRFNFYRPIHNNWFSQPFGLIHKERGRACFRSFLTSGKAPAGGFSIWSQNAAQRGRIPGAFSGV